MCVVLSSSLLRYHESVCAERDRLKGDLDTLQVKVSVRTHAHAHTHAHTHTHTHTRTHTQERSMTEVTIEVRRPLLIASYCMV